MNSFNTLRTGDSIIEKLSKQLYTSKELVNKCLNKAFQMPHMVVRHIEDDENYYIIIRKRKCYSLCTEEL
jgi:hypothetical protein